MKKYLINGAMALIVGGFIVSCSHDDISQPATVDQMTKSFDVMFTELYGPIAPNHNWGFETIAAEPGEEDLEPDFEQEKASTRSAERAATRTPAEFGWEVTDDWVSWGIFSIRNLFSRDDYQNILKLLPEEVDAANKLNNYEFISNGPFEFSIVYSQTGGADEIGYYYYNPNGDNKTITRVPFINNIQNDLGNYTVMSKNSWTSFLGMGWEKMTPDPTNAALRWTGNNKNNNYYRYSVAKIITVNVRKGYRIGFYVKQGNNPIMYSNQALNSGLDARPEGSRYYSAITNYGNDAYLVGLEDWFFADRGHVADCNDVILWIYNTSTIPEPVAVDDEDNPNPVVTYAYKEDYKSRKDTYMEIKDQGRVFCEDIATANMGVKEDIDYNDIVFDARVWRVYDTEVTTTNSGSTTAYNETGAKNVRYQYDISLLATGGTIEEKVNGVDVHNKFGVGQAFMVNTWTPNCVSSLSGQWNTPTNVITPKDFSYTLSYNEVDESNIGISTIPIEVKYGGNNMKALNNREINSEGKSTAPYKLCLPLGTQWPIERVNIQQAYSDFGNYVGSPDKVFYKGTKVSDNLYTNAPQSSIQDGKEKGAKVKIEGKETSSSWWVVWTGQVTEYTPLTLYSHTFAGGQTLRFFGKGILNVSCGSGSTERIISEGNLSEDGYIDVKISNAQAGLLSGGILVSGSNFKLTKIVVF